MGSNIRFCVTRLTVKQHETYDHVYVFVGGGGGVFYSNGRSNKKFGE